MYVDLLLHFHRNALPLTPGTVVGPFCGRAFRKGTEGTNDIIIESLDIWHADALDGHREGLLL